MKNIIIALVIIFGINSSHAQWWSSDKRIKGNKEVITKTVKTADYEKIKGKSSIDIILVSGKEGDITVKAESNIIDKVEIELKGNTLVIGFEDGYSISTTKGVTVTIPVEEVNGLSMSGSGSIISKTSLKSKKMDIAVAGSGDIITPTESQNLTISIAGSGDVKVSGRTENLKASVAGSGDINAIELKANAVNASIAGSGDISIYCDNAELNVSIAGSGDLKYKGKVNKLASKVAGSGDVIKM
jgi:hypothetical protein